MRGWVRRTLKHYGEMWAPSARLVSPTLRKDGGRETAERQRKRERCTRLSEKRTEKSGGAGRLSLRIEV